MKRELREKLCDLSFRVWGSRNRWQKMKKNKLFQVPVEVQHDKKATVKLKNGQIVNLVNAINKGLVQKVSEEQMKNLTARTVYQEPNNDELAYMLTCMLDEKVARLLDMEAASKGVENVENYFLPSVYQILSGDVHYPWNRFTFSQVDDEEYQAKMKEMLEEIPTDARSIVEQRLLSTENSKSAQAQKEAIDVNLFLSKCLEVEDLDELETKYNNFMDLARREVSFK